MYGGLSLHQVLHQVLFQKGSGALLCCFSVLAGLLTRARRGDPPSRLPSLPPCLCLSYGFYCSNNFYLNVVLGEGGKR